MEPTENRPLSNERLMNEPTRRREQTESASAAAASPEAVMEWARREYGAVSTFAEVDGPNRVSILLQADSDLPEECELNDPLAAPSALGRKAIDIREQWNYNSKESCRRVEPLTARESSSGVGDRDGVPGAAGGGHGLLPRRDGRAAGLRRARPQPRVRGRFRGGLHLDVVEEEVRHRARPHSRAAVGAAGAQVVPAVAGEEGSVRSIECWSFAASVFSIKSKVSL